MNGKIIAGKLLKIKEGLSGAENSPEVECLRIYYPVGADAFATNDISRRLI
jgi:hypothetical protein